ncbi:hypothetical protein [Spiroplasma endosymbiont of Nebria brevicollis]|uniref:hypothetical protein n=1 Tax=Spiroplasma endosymbiont of Nebria brevicollis TaxID=3066284 RepID=UPI00313E8AEF
MFVFKKINFILLLTFVWIIFWITVTIITNSYRNPILNYVPHSEDYLQNKPISSYVSKAQKPKHIVMIGIDGMAGYALKSGYSPNMNYLMHNGAPPNTLQARVMYYQCPLAC